MFEIKNIDHIVLNTTDEKTIIDFYCNILGCKLERRIDSVKLTQLRAGSSLIDIHHTDVENSGKPVRKNMEHFCLRIQPFDEKFLTAYFAKHDIQIKELGKRNGAEGMGCSFYIEDPEGNEIELSGSCD